MKINEKTIRNYLTMLNEESIKHLTTYKYEYALTYSIKFGCVCGEYAITKYTDKKREGKYYFRNTYSVLEFIDKEFEKYNKK